MCANPSWTNVPRHTTNFRSEKVHLTHPSFELCRNRLYLACVPTLNQCCKDTPQNLRPQDFHLTHPSFELCRSSSPYYTTHVSQPILNQRPKTHYKLQIGQKSSHTSLFWTLSDQITPRMCANPEPMWHRYTTKHQTPRFLSHTSLFWTLPGQLSILHHACVPTLNQCGKDTPQNLRPQDFHLTHPCFELCRNNSEQMTPRMCAHPEPPFQRYTTKPQTLRFSSDASVVNFAGTALHVTPRRWANPSWTNVPRHTTNFRSENFHLAHPCFELCRNNPEQITRMCANPSWTNVAKIHHKTSDPKIFISHIPLLNFARAALHITPHMWANPSWTNVPRHTTNFRSENFHLTHPCVELCQNSSPCYTTHVSQPVLYQRPKIHHKRLMTQFCKPILIQPPKVHLSKFQCSPYRRKKCRALQEDTAEWKPVCNLQAKKGSQ